MCEPTTIAFGLALMSAYGAMQLGKAQNNMAEATAENAHAAARFDYQQLSEQRDEIDEVAAQNKFQRQLQTVREQGTIAVAQGEAGVGGSSAMKVMQNAVMQGGYDISVIEANRVTKARQVVAKKFAVHAAAKGATNVAQAQTVSQGQQAMNIGISGVQGYMMGKDLGKSIFGGKTMTTGGLPDTSHVAYNMPGSG